MKDELGKGYMTEFVTLSPKVYGYKQSCLDNSLSEHKKAKGTKQKKKKNGYKKEPMYKKCLFENKMFKCI